MALNFLNNGYFASKVGIGTASPITKLQISATNATSPTANIFLDVDGNNVPGMGGQIIFGTSISATLTSYNARIQGIRSGLDNGSSDIHFQTTHVATATTPSTKMTILSDGKVGIGTSSPNHALDIEKNTSSLLNLYRPNSSTAASSKIDFSFNTANATEAVYARIISDVEVNTDSAQGGDLSFHTANAGTVGRVMTLTQEGKVGIGTASPDSALEVQNTPAQGSQTMMLHLDNNPVSNEGSGYLQISSGTNTQATLQIEQVSSGGSGIFGNNYLDTSIINRGLSASAYGNINFATGSSTSATSIVMTIGGGSQKGKVGIGTSNPQQRLQVGDGSFDAVTRNVFSDGEYVDIHGFGLYMSRGESYISPTNQATQTLNIGASSNKWSSIDANAITHRFLNGGSEKMRIDSSGNLSIGSTANVGYRLKVEGAGTVQLNNRTGSNGAVFAAAKDGTIVGSITVTSSATAFNTSSDYRLKEDLKDFEGLDLVSKIPVYDFKWKTDEKRSYGVMAHELQEVLSDAVNGEKDAEEMQGVDYSKIVPLLIKSIQELSAKVTVLENA